jgi:hypothetical protein
MNVDEDGATARRMWVRYETFHDVTYFTPESRAAADELGCKGGWMGYFGMRAAPLGAATPERAVSAFYNFHRSLVHRALPDAWEIASPERFLAARLLGADQSLRRMLGEDVLTGQAMAEAAELAVRAAGFAQTGGGRWPWRTPRSRSRPSRIWRCGRPRHCCASRVATVTSPRWSPPTWIRSRPW